MKQYEDQSDAEFVEIQSLMSELGFSSGVTRENAGRNYLESLCREICDFILPHLEKGMLTLFDVYCMYNRSRGIDLISPSDLKEACDKLQKLSLPISLKTLDSGVVVLQSNNIAPIIAEAVHLVSEHEHLSAMELGHLMGINPVISKEYLLEGEKMGELARDETIHGLHFYPNVLLTV
jgi:ESCRT-II complex subunit VPS36